MSCPVLMLVFVRVTQVEWNSLSLFFQTWLASPPSCQALASQVAMVIDRPTSLPYSNQSGLALKSPGMVDVRTYDNFCSICVWTDLLVCCCQWQKLEKETAVWGNTKNITMGAIWWRAYERMARKVASLITVKMESNGDFDIFITLSALFR